MTDLQDIEELMSLEEAQEFTSGLKKVAAWLEGKFVEMERGRPWVAMGYEDFYSWWVGEGLNNLQIDSDRRKAIAGWMHDEGTPVAAIASATNVSAKTTYTDIASNEALKNFTANAPIPGPSGHTLPIAGTYIPTSHEIYMGVQSWDDYPEGPNLCLPDTPEKIKADVAEVIALSKWGESESALRDYVLEGYAVVVDEHADGHHTNLIAWAKEHGLYVHVGRRGDKRGITGLDWGNPFEIPDDGDRPDVIRKYQEFYLPYKPKLMSAVQDLRGKVLGCWCAPKACHGDVLAQLANATIDGEVVA